MSKEILIIEDQPDLALALQEFLIEQGFNTAVAMNGRDAINMCRSKNFGLLLMDIALPDIDGREVAKKCLEYLPKLKVLFVTGQSNNLKLKIGPSVQFINKPCKPRVILDKLEEML